MAGFLDVLLRGSILVRASHCCSPIGILGAFAGWSRWLELRRPEAGRPAGGLWIACFGGVGLLLLFSREAWAGFT
jgi:copper resistance protein D